jgi:hypothetical protein
MLILHLLIPEVLFLYFVDTVLLAVDTFLITIKMKSYWILNGSNEYAFQK